MEGDTPVPPVRRLHTHFNPLPPHGGRHRSAVFSRSPDHFNPLPPHGGRQPQRVSSFRTSCISIHSLRMEGDFQHYFSAPFSFFISIHSLRMEGDNNVTAELPDKGKFQSTPSAWRETRHCNQRSSVPGISIHSLRMEGDKLKPCPFCGGEAFQSTPSAWRETSERCWLVLLALYFNPLPPHGGRLCVCWCFRWIVHFNPLPPHGGRPLD